LTTDPSAAPIDRNCGVFRRTVLAVVGTVGAAGCLSGDRDGENEATRNAPTGADTETPGPPLRPTAPGPTGRTGRLRLEAQRGDGALVEDADQHPDENVYLAENAEDLTESKDIRPLGPGR